MVRDGLLAVLEVLEEAELGVLVLVGQMDRRLVQLILVEGVVVVTTTVLVLPLLVVLES